jgi:hypothetical protein
VIQPSTGGLSWLFSSAIVFWPGVTFTGPYSKCSVCSPSWAAAGAAASSRQERAHSATVSRVFIAASRS